MLELNREYTRSLFAHQSCLLPADKQKLVQLDIEYLSILQIKNRTLKSLVGEVNSELKLEGEHAVTFDFD
jgi:hypothetical protein